ncbi:IS66 family transposase [Ralstonia chuxiongensis]|uniref:IS66 family transposase n=1 Tax=Ralstonia chuxiongensis TaxID=2957504 RepID=UPI0028F66D62|nr:IS66 family transposase [Ralstonia chuxiongensis]CAJ0785286.1 IS66 family transposase ISBmu30 [Ralstonia chuxiongensis]
MTAPDIPRLPRATKAYIHELETGLAERDAKIDELVKRIETLEEQYCLALAQRFAPKSEKRRDRVFNEAEQLAEIEADEGDDELPELPETGLPDVESTTPRKRGRKPLPTHLPRERVEYDLPEDQKTCSCCGHSLHRIGEDISEQLHYEVKVTVLQNARFKYACRHCEAHAERTPILLAPMPAQPLPGSHASAAIIATVTAGKYVDGTPLYRMADVLARSNIPVGRGTLANWVIRPSELHYSRLYDALRKTLLLQRLIHGDETTVQVLKEPGKSAQSKSYMWCYRSAEDCAEPVVLFDYQPGRGQEHPKAFLGDYQGMLMSDGYSAWRTLKKATHFGCMAHARRLFTDALKGQKNKPSARVTKALEYFQALYQVEALAKGKLPEDETRIGYTYRLRQQHSVPLLNAFKDWLDELAPKVLPQSLLGKAISYCRNQWPHLSRYVMDGHAPIDNNVIERDIRPFVTGRKSWLHSDTVAGAKASATVYSLMLTCRACGVEPYAYLLHVLTELPQRAPDADISDLLPFNYAKRQAKADVS